MSVALIHAMRIPSPSNRRPANSGVCSSQIQFLEEIIALVVDHDECGKILHLDSPNRLHAELGIFHGLDLLDAMLGEVCRRATDGGEIKAAVLAAGFAHRR